MTSRLAHRLAEIIEREAQVQVTPVIIRTYAGRHQRAAGAWRWFMREVESHRTVGSQERATQVLRRGLVRLYDFAGLDIHMDTDAGTHEQTRGVGTPVR